MLLNSSIAVCQLYAKFCGMLFYSRTEFVVLCQWSAQILASQGFYTFKVLGLASRGIKINSVLCI